MDLGRHGWHPRWTELPPSNNLALALATALGGCVSINVNEADEKVDVAPMPSALVGTWDVGTQLKFVGTRVLSVIRPGTR